MSHHIDFATLSIKDTLDLAIMIEEEAKERYEEFADQMDAHHTPDTARFFRTMAENELKHAEMITARRRLTCGDEPVTVDRALIVEAEAPSYEGARAFMSINEALEVAMAAEVKAYEFYDGALPEVSDPNIRELFVDLRDQEAQHQQMIKAIMAKVPADGPFDPDDFADDPTAQ